MGSFNASLRAVGDATSLKATVELVEDRLSIVAGSTEIGNWPLHEIRLEETPTGYRMAAEGEQILIELTDVESFAAELATRTKKRRKLAKPTKSGSETVTSSKISRREKTKTQDSPAPAPARAPREPGTGATEKGVLGLVDRVLAKAQKKFGPYLPEWMFSRAMFFIGVAALLTMILLPGVFSVLLVVAGALLVLFGAVVYSDAVLASKWLPGRANPQQALLLGLSVLLLGVLLGVVAR